MNTNEARYITTIIVNSKQAQDRLAELTTRFEQLSKERKEAFKRGEIYAQEAEFKAVGKELKQVKQDVEGFASTVGNLSAAKPKEIREAIASINRQLNSGDIERGSEAWKAMQQTLGDLRAELKGIKDEGADSAKQLDTAVSGLQGALGGVAAVATSAVKAYADMDTAMADVRKYTGLSQQQVEQLNEEFKKMDTRTSRTELNELAGAAGRLGITATDQILEFVDGANKINVALGDDLGKGAVDSIGKLAQMFGEADNMGLRQAMLATGSAVNELAQSSSASAGYIVDFTADLSGVGKMAGFTQAQLMGIASALDQNMQEEKTSATVFSQLITKMYQDPAKFARIAGQDVATFSTLLRTDANAALTQFLQSMQARGGFAQLAPMFESMNLNGTRAVGVLSAVASNLDMVTEAQQVAATAYATGNSVLAEYDVQNNTAQATLDKMQQGFTDLTVTLGQALWPAFEQGSRVLTSTASILSTVLQWLFSNKATLVTLVAAYAAATLAVTAYNVQQRLAAALHAATVLATNLHTVAVNAWSAATKAATAASTAFTRALQAAKVAMATNPITAAALAVAALTAAVTAGVAAYKEHQRTSTAAAQALEQQRAAAQAVADVQKRAATIVEEEKAKVAQLTEIIHSNTYSVDQRRQAVRALHAIIPAYNATITEEGNITRENTAAITEYIRQLDRLAMAKAVASKKEDLAKSQLEAEQRLRKSNAMLSAIDNEQRSHPEKYDISTVGSSPLTHTAADTQKERNYLAIENQREEWREKKAAAESELRSIKARREALNGYIATSREAREAVVAAATAATTDTPAKATGPSPTTTTTSTGATADPAAGSLKAYQQQQKQIEQLRKRGELSASEAYDREATALQEHYNHLLDLQEKNGQDITAATEQARQEAYDITERYVQAEEQERKQRLEAALAADSLAADEETMQAAQAYLGGEATYDQYQQQLDQIALQHAHNRADLTAAEGFDNSKEQAAATALDVKAKQGADQQAQQDGTASFNAAYEAATTAAQRLAVIQQYEELEVLSHEEAEKKKTEISQEQEKARQQAAQQAYQQLSQLTSSYTSYISACSSLEQAQVTKKYDAEIEKAGSNTKQGQKLEEKKQKALAKIKSRYAKKQAQMQIAQAIAEGAMACISAYKCGVSVGGPWGIALGVAFAAAAAVQTGLQIATIKKQAQAQEEGYYSGGYTGGTDYRRRAGIVHQGEFVINHEALANPAVAAIAATLDQAQQAGTASRLTADDVAAALPASAAAVEAAALPAAASLATIAAAPALTEQPSQPTAAATATNAQLAQSIKDLNRQLAQGITAIASIDGQNGIYRQLKHYERLNS